MVYGPYSNGAAITLRTGIRKRAGSNFECSTSYYGILGVFLSTCTRIARFYLEITPRLPPSEHTFTTFKRLRCNLVQYYVTSTLPTLSSINTTRLISVYSSPSSYKNKVVTLPCHLLTVIVRYRSAHDTFITIFRRNPSDTLAAESATRTSILRAHTHKNVQSTVSTKSGEFPTQNAVVYNKVHGPAAFIGALAMKICKNKSTASTCLSVRPSFCIKKRE
jgi:hypothetical protein